MRYAWLARSQFDSIELVQDTDTRWLWAYNHLIGTEPQPRPLTEMPSDNLRHHIALIAQRNNLDNTTTSERLESRGKADSTLKCTT